MQKSPLVRGRCYHKGRLGTMQCHAFCVNCLLIEVILSLSRKFQQM